MLQVWGPDLNLTAKVTHQGAMSAGSSRQPGRAGVLQLAERAGAQPTLSLLGLARARAPWHVPKAAWKGQSPRAGLSRDPGGAFVPLLIRGHKELDGLAGAVPPLSRGAGQSIP